LDSGIDVRTLGLGAASSLLDLVAKGKAMKILRTTAGGSLFRDLTAGRVSTASAMAVVSIDGDRPEDYVIGGSAMERVWTAATAAGLGVVPISPVFLYARSEADLASLSPNQVGRLTDLQRSMDSLIGIEKSQAPVLIMRFCHSPQDTIRSLRRPLSEVVISSQNTDGIS
jgi:hypothetical protein